MHMDTHGGKFPCKTCGRRFDSRLKRTKHQFIHTGAAGAISPLECAECHRTFSSRLTLAEHQAWHEGRMLYSCPTCGQQFRQNTGLWRHLRTHDPNAPRRRYPCPRCSREFARLDYLKEHLAAHDERHKGRFVCDVCERSFFQSSDLNRHRLTHSSERRQFECSVCKRLFSNASSRKRHEKEHDPAQRMACPDCGATFKRPCQLKEHVVKNHGDAALLKLRAQKKRIGRTADSPGAERKKSNKSAVQNHCDTLPQKNSRGSTGTARGQPGSSGDNLLKERLAARVGAVSAGGMQACGRLEGDGSTGPHEQHHLNKEGTMSELGFNTALLRSEAGEVENLVGQLRDGSNPCDASHRLQEGSSRTCMETVVVDRGDILQRSLRGLPVDCMEEDDFGGGEVTTAETNFVNRPDFGSQAYYDWLAEFTSICNLTTLPLDNDMFTKVTQVLKTISDALAVPYGVLACRENFKVLLSIMEDLQRTVGSHLNFVLENLQPS
ncbi:uncharacterized protein LOC144101747 isoform X2 [Amblyomma americanum]